MKLSITKEEAKYLLEWCDSIVQTETDSVHDYGDEFKPRLKFWKKFRKQVRGVRRGR